MELRIPSFLVAVLYEKREMNDLGLNWLGNTFEHFWRENLHCLAGVMTLECLCRDGLYTLLLKSASILNPPFLE